MISILATAAHANVLGDMQTFAPNSDGLDFITVHSSRPLTQGCFAFGGHLSFAKDHLVVFKDFNAQERYDYKDYLVEFDMDIAYAITSKFSAFFAAPTLLYQESKAGQEKEVKVIRGVHTYRPGFKWTLGSGITEVALVASIDILNVKNSPYTGVTPNNIYNLELAKMIRAGDQVTYGLNLGYRFRNPTAIPADAYMFPLKDQFTFSAGRSAPAFGKARWVLEGIFSLPVDKGRYKRVEDSSSADILLGFKHRLLRRLNLDWGGTIEPFVQTQSPRYRAFVGLVYYFNPGWGSNKDTEQVPPPVAPAAANTAAEVEASNDEAAAAPNASTLKITPEKSDVYEGTMVHFTVTGGERPYAYHIVAGQGRFSTEKVYYRAPLFPETAEIEVTDANGQSKYAEVIVRTPPVPKETIRLKNLNFIFDTDILVKSSQAEINRIVGLFKGRNVARIIVEGHTDSKGSTEYNEELSEKRAAAVARVLSHNFGLRDDQVSAIGFGEARPIATNATAKGRAQNRRVDLKVYYGKP